MWRKVKFNLFTNKSKSKARSGAHAFERVTSVSTTSTVLPSGTSTIDNELSVRESLALGFPVAMKSSTTTNGHLSWSSMMADDMADGDRNGNLDRKVNDDEHTYLHPSSSYEWGSMLLLILNLPYNRNWQIIVVASIVFNYIWKTFQFCFLAESNMEEAKIQLPVISYTVDIIYLIDLILAILHRYWRSLRKRILIRKRKRLAIIVDGITLFPAMYLYALIVDLPNIRILFWLQSITFIRLYRVQVYFNEWRDSAAKAHFQLFAIRYVLYLFILLHSVACIWNKSACKDCNVHEDSWTKNLEHYSLNLDINNFMPWYFLCIYFSLSTLCNTGLGDISATNQFERITCIWAMFLGFALTTGIYIGSLSSQIVNITSRKALFTDKIRAIKSHLTAINISSKMRASILKYYETLWSQKMGVKKAPDFDLLPKPLQMEVCYDINISHFSNSFLFRDFGEAFLRQLSLLMKNEFHLAGDIIYHQNVAKPMMICVASGVIEILSDEDNESPMISFTSGTILGEVAMAMTVPAKATVRAATYVELQVLNKVDFARMMNNHPEIYAKVRATIAARIDALSRRESLYRENKVELSLFVSRATDKNSIGILKDKLRELQAKTDAQRPIRSEFEKKNQFNTDFLNMYKISENISFKEQPALCLTSNIPYILQPRTSLINAWEHIIFAIVLFIGFIYPDQIGYRRSFPPWLVTTSFLTDTLFVIDIYIQCTTAIEEKTQVIDKVLPILYKRMESYGFYLDVFSVFPLEVLGWLLTVNTRNARLTTLLRLNRLLKLWRLPAYFAKMEKSLWANLVVIRICKYCIYLMLMSHWAGVALYMQACFYELCSEDSWFSRETDDEILLRKGTTCYKSPGAMSQYFALMILSGVGYGDITPRNSNDLTMVCTLMAAGIVLFGFCIAEFSATYSQIGRKRVDFQETVFAIKMFMKENHMHIGLKDRVITYFQLQWNFNKGESVTNEKGLGNEVTLEMKQEVLSKERMDTLLQVPLFMYTDLDCVQLVATGSKLRVLPPNEIISYAGGISREMYVVQEGYCGIVSDNTGEVERVVGPGSHFGDLEMLYGITMVVTVKTVTHCKLISIEYSVYSQAISLFPNITREMQDLMNEPQFALEIAKLHAKRKTIHFNKHHHLNTNNTRARMVKSIVKLRQEIQESCVNVKRHCRLSAEFYHLPFVKLGKFRFCRYLLMPICILPHGRLMKVWAILRIFAAFIVGVLGPLQQSVSPYGEHMMFIIYILDYFAYMNVYLMFHVGYFNEKGLLVTHPYSTARHYLTGSFIIDFIACFPVEYLLTIFPTHTEGHTAQDHLETSHPQHCIVRLNRVLQMHRLPGAFSYLEKDILRKTDIIRVVKFLPFTIVLINMWASVLVSVNCQYRYKGTNHLESSSTLLSINATQMFNVSSEVLTSDEDENYHNDVDFYANMPEQAELAQQMSKRSVNYGSTNFSRSNMSKGSEKKAETNNSASFIPKWDKIFSLANDTSLNASSRNQSSNPGASFGKNMNFSALKMTEKEEPVKLHHHDPDETGREDKIGHMDCHTGTWLSVSHFNSLNHPIEIYIIAYYWVTTTFTGVGFGEISAQTEFELYMVMLMILVGILMFGYMFANIASSKASLHSTMSLYQEMIQELICFMDRESVDKHLQKKLLDNFEYEWKRTSGIKSHVIFDTLHTALMEDAVLWMYEKTLREVPLFENIEPSFFRVIGKHLEQCYILRGQTIIRSQDVQSNIYIIYRGKVEVLSTYNEMIACMGPGGLFGNIASSVPNMCSVTIIASRNLDALVIPSETFYNVLKMYPAIKHNMDIVLGTAKDYVMPTTIFQNDSSTSVNVTMEGDERMQANTSGATINTTGTNQTSNTTTSRGMAGNARNLLMPSKWFHFALLPTSFVYCVLSYTVVVASYLNIAIISYRFSFQDTTYEILMVSISLEIVFLLKILLELHEAYVDHYGDYVVDPKKIRLRYLKDKTRLLLDIIPNLPVDLLAFCAPYGQRMQVLSFIRLLHLLRFVYIIQFFKRRANLLMVNKLYLQMSLIIIWLTLLSHGFACLWYIISCPLAKCRKYTWAYYNLNDPEYTPFDKYLQSLYFIVAMFTTTGYGDVVPHTILEVVLCTIMMIFSKFAIALFIGDITSVLNSYASTLVNYEYGISELRDSLSNQYLSSHQMEKVWNYVRQLWKHGRGKQTPRFINTAPYVLKSDLMNAMYGHHLRNSYIFTKLNDDFLRQLTVRLKHYVYFTGNYIVQHGDTDQNMYFIHRGEVDVLTVHSNLTESIHDVLRPGDVFGVAQGLYHGLPHHFSFRARTIVDIVTLHLDTWYNMLQFFPEAKGIIYERAANIYIQV